MSQEHRLRQFRLGSANPSSSKPPRRPLPDSPNPALIPETIKRYVRMLGDFERSQGQAGLASLLDHHGQMNKNAAAIAWRADPSKPTIYAQRDNWCAALNSYRRVFQSRLRAATPELAPDKTTANISA